MILVPDILFGEGQGGWLGNKGKDTVKKKKNQVLPNNKYNICNLFSLQTVFIVSEEFHRGPLKIHYSVFS